MALERHAESEMAIVAPGEGRKFYDWCRETGHITIGWLQGVDMTGWNYGSLVREFESYYPLGSERWWDGKTWTPQMQKRAITQIADFLLNLGDGRHVVMPNSGSTRLMLGRVRGPYEHRTDLPPSEDGYEHYHRVEWLSELDVAHLDAARTIGWSARQTVRWIEQPKQIRDIVERAGSGLGPSGPSQTLLPPLDEGDEFPEGRELYVTHRVRERNPKAVHAKKAAEKASGGLACEVCGFDFALTYGDVGRDYIECHHAVPISEYTEDQSTKLEDLHLVCANCHRMLHRARPWMTVNELTDHLSSSEDGESCTAGR